MSADTLAANDAFSPIYVITGQLSAGTSTVSKALDTSILEGVMREIDGDLARGGARPGWHAIGNSDEWVDATVERILSVARVPQRETPGTPEASQSEPYR